MTQIHKHLTETIGDFTIEKITESNKAAYVAYCQKYRFEHDESDLYDDQLEVFDPSDDKQPTYRLINEAGETTGMVSLRLMPYLENETRGRFAIFHVIEPLEEAYALLWEAIEPHTRVLNHVFLFLPEAKPQVGEIVKNLAFELDRYVWVLDRGDFPIETPVFPEGMSLRTYQGEADAPDWCTVRNGAFASLKGSETPITVQDVVKMSKDSGAVDGGMLILSDPSGPVGVIRVGKEVEDDKTYAFIGPVAVLPAYQGRGLGRQLLRAGVAFGRENGMPHAMLCVNADNARAADLYLSEGFEKQVVMICYKKETFVSQLSFLEV